MASALPDLVQLVDGRYIRTKRQPEPLALELRAPACITYVRVRVKVCTYVGVKVTEYRRSTNKADT